MINQFIQLGNTVIRRDSIIGAEFDEPSSTCYVYVTGMTFTLRGDEGKIMWKFLTNKSRNLLENFQRQALRAVEAEEPKSEKFSTSIPENPDYTQDPPSYDL